VTSFHGLPSDRTHAIAQTEFGVTWFATDGGLARYDGRRTSAINAEGLPPGRVLALKTDATGALWIGTDNGAARSWNGKFDTVPETAGQVITAIISPQADRAIMVSEGGQIFDCEVKRPTPSTTRSGEGTPGLSFAVKTIPNQPLQSADKDHPGLLKITSLALLGEKLFVGTQSRGDAIENGGQRNRRQNPTAISSTRWQPITGATYGTAGRAAAKMQHCSTAPIRSSPSRSPRHGHSGGHRVVQAMTSGRG
jgi:hypothetical protein